MDTICALQTLDCWFEEQETDLKKLKSQSLIPCGICLPCKQVEMSLQNNFKLKNHRQKVEKLTLT